MSQEQGDSRYLYEQIYSTLKEEILSGQYKKGDWFPPERVLKERFGTTHLTVRNALAKLVLEGYIERYSGKGTIVMYARSPRPAPRKVLRFPGAHVILGDLDETRARFLASLETLMRSLPLAVRVSCHHGDLVQARSLFAEGMSGGALVVVESAWPGIPGLFEGTPPNTIVTGAPIPETGCPQVVIDDVEAGRRAARHLLAAGHSAVAVIAEAGPAPEHPLYRGLVGELTAHRLPEGSAVFQSCGPGSEAAPSALRAVLSRCPDCRAFICGSDETAAGVARALREPGGPPERTVAVVGYGNTRLARAVQMTSLDPCMERLAESVVACAREGMSQGVLPSVITSIVPELVIRQ